MNNLKSFLFTALNTHPLAFCSMPSAHLLKTTIFFLAFTCLSLTLSSQTLYVPNYSSGGIQDSNNGNVGIGVSNPAWKFEINGNDVQVTQIRPLRSDWDDLGLIMDTYWASNLNQTVWSQAAVSVIGINSNQYAGNIHGITNNINVVEERETIFFKTIIR